MVNETVKKGFSPLIHGRLRNPGVTIYDANLIIFQLQFVYIKAPEVKMAFFYASPFREYSQGHLAYDY